MHRRTRALALTAALALTITGCGTSSAKASPTVLTVQVTDDGTGEAYRALLGEYDREHADVKIVVRDLASADARQDLFDNLGRTGLTDIVTVEYSWLPDLLRYSDLFAAIPKDALGDDEGRWPDWALRSATDDAGRVIAYPAGIAPRALCYRPDLLAAAGLPSDPASVGDLAATWPGLLQAAQEYTTATGRGFLDSAASAFFVMMDEHAAPFEIRATGEIVAATNPAVRTAFDRVTADPAIFAGVEPGTEEWQSGAEDGAFAASFCAAGTVGDVIPGGSEIEAGTGTLAALLAAGWQIAEAFPGGGATSAASYLAVPAAGSHVDRAREVADWLTAPEQQIALFTAAGAFPSMVLAAEEETDADAAASDPDAGENAAAADALGDDGTNPDADADTDADADAKLDAADAPDGDPSATPTPGVDDPFAAPLAATLRDRAVAITTMRFRGPASAEIEDLMRTALTSVRSGTSTPADAWDRWSAAVDALT